MADRASSVRNAMADCIKAAFDRVLHAWRQTVVGGIEGSAGHHPSDKPDASAQDQPGRPADRATDEGARPGCGCKPTDAADYRLTGGFSIVDVVPNRLR